MARTAETAYGLLRRAVEQRLQVVAIYDGLERELCPHVLGRSADGAEQALVYQFGGDTHGRPLERSGSPGNWRCVLVEELSKLRLRTGPWHSAGNYSAARQSCVAEVDVAA